MIRMETLSVQELASKDSETPTFAATNETSRRTFTMSRGCRVASLLAVVSMVAVISVVAVAVPTGGNKQHPADDSKAAAAPPQRHPQIPVAAAFQQLKEKVIELEETQLGPEEVDRKEVHRRHPKHAPKSHKHNHHDEQATNIETKQHISESNASKKLTKQSIQSQAKAYRGHLATRSKKDGTLICETPECSIAASMIVSSMNVSVDPCEDFYEFACGGWMAAHPAPPSSGTFNQVNQLMTARLHLLLQTEAAPSDPEPLHKVRTVYQSCLDTDTMDSVGVSPLWDALQSQGGWPIADDQWGLMPNTAESALAAIRTLWFEPMLAASIDSDLFNTSRKIFYIGEGTTGIDESILAKPNLNPEIMEAYHVYVIESAKQLRDFLGSSITDEQIAQDAEELISFESEMAKLMVKSGTANITEAVTKMTLKELQNVADNVTVGGFDYLDMMHLIFFETDVMIDENEEVYLVEGPEYIQGLNTLLSKTKCRVLANYFGWIWVLLVGGETTYAMKKISDEFVTIYTGHEIEMTRDTFCSVEANNNMAMIMSRAYVDEFFPDGAKEENEQMVDDLRSSFGTLLDNNDFLTPEDLSTAKEKLAAIEEFVAYPAWILDDDTFTAVYEGLTINAGEQFQNLINIGSYKSYWYLETYRVEPRSSFVLPPTVVNAFYSPSDNSITILAGILQNPFYQHNSLAALNYGGIGMVIGHELTHGFDNTGRMFDKDGDLALWWSQESIDAFNKRAQCFVDQYNTFHPPEVSDPSVHVNGKNTLGENIADNGGIREAFDAYQVFVDRNGEEPRLPGLDEYTPHQLYYLSNANLWCESKTEENILAQLERDVHSPGRFRVLGPCSNDAEFSKVWGCSADSAMNRGDDRCQLW